MSKGDLLIFVPDSFVGTIIDLATDRYGYSHVAVDIGNGQMIEAVKEGVVRSPIGKYGDRAFTRINISDKINVDAFIEYLQGKVDSKCGYDILEALTFGLLDDPDKYTCSGLVAGFEEIIKEFDLEGFITPNDIAKNTGAPLGKDVGKSTSLDETLEMLERRKTELQEQLKDLEEKEREMDLEISRLLDEYNECSNVPPFSPEMEECDKIKEKILGLYHEKNEIYEKESDITEELRRIEKQISEIEASL